MIRLQMADDRFDGLAPFELRSFLGRQSLGLASVHDAHVRVLAINTPVSQIHKRGHRLGQTVGYFIPTRSQDAAELEALRQASEALDTMLARHKVAADDIIADYKKARRKGSR